MGRLKYNFDEEGANFYIFAIIFLSCIVIPYTLYTIFVAVSAKSKSSHRRSVRCRCEACKKKEQWLRKNEPNFFLSKKFIFLLHAWVLLLALAKVTYDVELSSHKMYDPFEVLGVSPGVSEEEIKRHYRRLTLKMHPDRVAGEDREEAEQKFIELQKAYKALTDEVTRKNWEETGNPDGIRNFTLGTALPSWLVEQGNVFWVIATYAAVLGLLLPFFVGRWWYRAKSYTKDGIHYVSMGLFYGELKDNTTVKKLFEILTASYEFKDAIQWRKTDSVAIPQLMTKVKEQYEQKCGEKYEKSKKFAAPFCSKSATLLLAHMFRIPVERTLVKDQVFVVETAVKVLHGMVQISLARGWTQTAFHAMTLSECIIQAIYFEGSALLQLPHLDDSLLQSIRNKKKNIRIPRDILDYQENDRRSIMETLTDEQYQDVVEVARNTPRLFLLKAKFVVLGEEQVVTGSTVTAVFYFVLIRDKEEENLARKILMDERETTIAQQAKALLQGTSGSTTHWEGRQGKEISMPGDIHAPYYPKSKTPSWWVVLTSTRSKSLLTVPYRTSRLPYARAVYEALREEEEPERTEKKEEMEEEPLSKELDEVATEKRNISEKIEPESNKVNMLPMKPTLVLQFPASNEAGTSSVTLDVRPDSWIQSDFHSEFKFLVHKDMSESKNSRDSSAGDSDWNMLNDMEDDEMSD